MAVITSWIVYDILILLSALLTAFYLYFKYKFRYFNGRRIPTPGNPVLLYGHFSGAMSTKNMTLIAADLYFKMKGERFFGCFFFGKPIIIVRDPDLLKNMLVKDFSNFHDRGFELITSNDPLLEHLFMLEGQEWRNLRVKMTPTFTSGKMKMMFPTLVETGKQLITIIEKCAQQPETDIKDILARYTTDVISSCAFGIETNSLENPDAEFRKMGAAALKPTKKTAMIAFLFMVFPELAKYLPFRMVPKEINDFFIGTVRDTMQYRKDNNVQRKDFMQLLMELREKGYVADADNKTSDKEPSKQQTFTLGKAAAQAFIFFIAGFETSSSTMQLALYELALNTDIQKTLQNEIDDQIEKHGGNITHESLLKMTYLDNVVSETLRKHPIVAVTVRACSTDYVIPGSDTEVKKGESVFFPVYAFHHDPQYFPDPDRFDPDRFLPEEKDKRHPYTYFPFGEGPRSCIGNRFALMQIKTGLAIILSNFNVEPSSKTPIPIVFDPKADILAPKENLYLKITKRVKK